MNVLLMFAGVFIVYLLVTYVYRRNWNKGLTAELHFDRQHVVRGESVNIVEVVTNAKRLPLGYVNLKFQVSRGFQFSNADTNSNTTDRTYRNDVFSFLANQRITRRIPVKCTARGVYRIDGLDLTFAGVFMNEINVLKLGAGCEITVYPKPAGVSALRTVQSRIMGEAERRKYMLEDPFVFRGIRDYCSTDSMKNVNWKATARTGNLMVNEYNESVSHNVCILLNLEDDSALKYDFVDEEAISIASGLAQMFIEQRVNVSMICNGCDTDTGSQAIVGSGSGISHLDSINTVLARIDLSKPVEEYSSMLERLLLGKRAGKQDESIYVVVSASRRKKLQEVIKTIADRQGDMVWIVPCISGGEYELEYCDVKPVRWQTGGVA